MRKTDRDIQGRNADLMRLAGVLLRSAMMLAVVTSLLAFVSCGNGSGDDPDTPGTTPDQPKTDKPIVFSALQQGEQEVTRATTTTPLEDKNVNVFEVWGFKNTSYDSNSNSYGSVQTVIGAPSSMGYHVVWTNNSAYTTTSNTDGWEYVNKQNEGEVEQTIKYWDWSANAYRFFGVTDVTKTTVTGGSADYRISFKADAAHEDASPYYSRLWFSTGNPTDYPTRQFGQPVKLEFLKPFAYVRFVFVPSDPGVTLEELKITAPSFGPITSGQKIAVNGTFTVIYPLTGLSISESWNTIPGTDDDDKIPPFSVAYTDANQKWYTVLPAVGQGAFKLQMTVNGDPDKGCTIAAEYMDWLPGYSYTYVFKVSEEGGVNLGEVLTAYTNWKTASDGEYTIYNW